MGFYCFDDEDGGDSREMTGTEMRGISIGRKTGYEPEKRKLVYVQYVYHASSSVSPFNTAVGQPY